MDIKKSLSKLGFGMQQHSPELLMGTGVALMAGAIIFAVRATPKAMKLKEERKAETKLDIVKACWKPYVPTAAMAASGIFCILMSDKVMKERSAALVAAYAISETARKEYKSKVTEILGEKKEREITEAIDKDKVKTADDVSEESILRTGNGETLCLDALSGRYFRSDIESIRRGVNELNHQLLNEGVVYLNDYYYCQGLDSIGLGSDLGWDTSMGMIDIRFSSQLTPSNKPCVVVNLDTLPVADARPFG